VFSSVEEPKNAKKKPDGGSEEDGHRYTKEYLLARQPPPVTVEKFAHEL
jgi:hypothetical protein